MELLNPCFDTLFPAKTVSFTGTAGVSTDWPNGPQGVIIWSDVPCYVIAGVDVTATTANALPIPAGVPIFVKVQTSISGSGGTWRVSAIQISDSGTLYAKPGNKS